MSVVNIAYRNLSRQKRRTFLLAGAIAFGVLVITLVNGVVGGLLRNIENNFAALLSAHVMVTGVEFGEKNRMFMRVADDPRLKEAMDELAKKFPVKYYHHRTSVFNGATLINQTESTGRQVDGVDWKHDKFLADQLDILKGNLDGMDGGTGIVIGEKTAKALNVQVGESIIIQTETVYGQQNTIDAPVKAIFRESNISGGTVYMDIEAVNGLLNMPKGSFNWYGVFLNRFDDQDAAAQALQDIFVKQNLKAYPRDKVIGKDFNTLFSDIRKDKDKTAKLVVIDLNDQLAGMRGVFGTIKAISVLVLIILLAVIMVGLNNTYRIIVWERNREIGTMRALGMQRGTVSWLFLLEALFLALFGVVIGMVLAVGILMVIAMFTFTPGDFSIFLNKNHLTWSFDVAQLVTTIVLVALLTLLAARSPARKAGKVEPAVALRTTA
jgi:putative ABC transport system permease protein